MGWQTKKLTEISEVKTGKWDANHAVEDGKYKFFTCAYESFYCDTKRFEGECIILPGNGVNVGEVFYYSGEFDAYQRTYVISDIEIEPKYLFYHLKCFWRERNLNKQFGSATNYLKIGNFKDYEVSFPPVPEQKRIVAILDRAFADIDRARELTEHNLNNARELFESYLQQVFSELSDECEMRSMSDGSILTMIDGDRGVNYPKKSEFSENGHCLFLSTKNVRSDGFLFEELLFIDEDRDTLLRKGKLSRNDVIITTRGTIGNLALYDESVPYENIRINSGMLILRPNTEIIEPSYLFEIMRSGIVKRQIAEKVSGAAQPQLPIKTLYTFTIPVAKTRTKQLELVGLIKIIESQYKNLERLYNTKITTLDELKKSLLQKAFNGELELKSCA